MHDILISKFISFLLNIDRNKCKFQLMDNYAFDGKLVMHNGISNLLDQKRCSTSLNQKLYWLFRNVKDFNIEKVKPNDI